ncbi:MAG: SUMF1/EgtB/PvdO family nonheme iron enzyme [Chloroflexi bacterium]|nr:SUMF1/EgtB/PvdO family nonheme iron enzyme [Chloroflexota bacterium]
MAKRKVSKTQIGKMTGGTIAQGDIRTERDFIGRDKINNITVIIGMNGYMPAPDLALLRDDYRAHLRRNYRALDFKGIPQLDNLSRELLLEEVYVPLVARGELPSGETWERRLAGRKLDDLPEHAEVMLAKGEAAPVRVEQALAQKSRVVVIGDPGSGKSTLLKHLALRLASEPNAPLPILVPLNAYADALSRGDRNLQTYLAEYFAGLGHGIANLAPLFDDSLAKGQAVILLDGLDEVQRDRAHLVARVEAFAHEAIARGNKLVVTSRVVGYRESPLDAQAWSLFTLLDFDRAAIEEFATKWCWSFEKSVRGDTPEAHASAEEERKSLLESIDANPGVARLASNPLLLTILALIKRQGVSLPNRRVELYELYLRTLITAWSKARALDKRPVGPPLDYLETIGVLGPLALWLREENPTAGIVSEERLRGWLSKHFQGDEWGMKPGPAAVHAREFLASVRTYSNLLLERGQGRYGFIHLTFEEALAARGLVRLGEMSVNDSLAIIRAHLTDPGWRETILLSVGVWGLVREEWRKAGEVARAILQVECDTEHAGKNILLAGACLEDVGERGLGRVAAQEITDALLAAYRNRALPPTVQRDAGFILGRIGWTPPDLDAFIPIPAGEFLYGDDKRRIKFEKPFAIAKYPVTNRQFRKFVEAKGYDRRELWSDEGWSWRTGTWDSQAPDYLKDWLAKRPAEQRCEPFWWHDIKWNNPLAPVVGVSWFEAEAYCNWLSKELGKPVRLPTEEEWERAARHVDGRAYPWGDRFDHNRLSAAEFWAGKDNLDWNKWYEAKGYEVATTTVVGQFPEGNSQPGISDLSGNVWEWTGSWYEDKKENRVVRGGSWNNGASDARCAFRLRGVPVLFYGSFGFRLCSPGSIPAF